MADEPRIDGRSLRYARRRAELVEAAAEYVLSNGVADLSFRPLASAVGVSPSVLVNHFHTKEQLITEVLGFLGARMSYSRDGSGDHGDLADYGGWWYRWTNDASLPIIRLSFEVVGLAMQTDGRFADFREFGITGWVAVTRSQLGAAGCPEEEIEATATSLVAHLTGLMVDLLLTGDRERVNAAHDLFVRSIEERRASWTAQPRDI